MLNKNKILMITVMGAIAGMSSGAKAQTFYQCLPCGAGKYTSSGTCQTCPMGTYSTTGASSCTDCGSAEFSDSNRLRCYSVNESENWSFAKEASSGSCETYTIPTSGLYVVYLRGGKGGKAGSCLDYRAGKIGGYVQYKFTATAGTSIQLCAGGNGTNATGTAGGGGAGSWIKIGGKYIVAGGGGGGGYQGGKDHDTKGQAGGGGAIGAGGSGDDFSCEAGCAGAGGSVGDYAGAAGQCGKHDGSAGEGISADNAGKGGRSGGGYGEGGEVIGFDRYGGYRRYAVGGGGNTEGAATHDSNISLQLNCSDENTGCAALYKWKYN